MLVVAVQLAGQCGALVLAVKFVLLLVLVLRLAARLVLWLVGRGEALQVLL